MFCVTFPTLAFSYLFIIYLLLVCVYYDPPVINILMLYLPIHTMLVLKLVVGLGKGLLHFMYTVCLQG